MEKVQTLLLILFGLGAFVWRMVQKARDTAAQEIRERPGAKVPPLPNTSFQELLKQMQAQNEAGRQESAAPLATSAPRQPTLPRQTPRPGRRAEPQPRAMPVPPTAPPESRRIGPIRPLEPTRPGPDRRNVTDMLRNPADVRAAFVLSEILKRKFE